MTDDKKPSETVTVEMLSEIFSCLPKQLSPTGRYNVYELLAAVHGAIGEWKKSRADTPSPRPEPAVKNGDWVVVSEGGIVGTCPWRVGNRSWYGDKPPTRRLWPQIESDPRIDRYESDLLPIPPKPDKVQEGYKLTGAVKVVDGSEPYVLYESHTGNPLGWVTCDKRSSEYFGGRRWMVVLDPKCCPHCHKELSE